ncbi:hypothetical protein BDZ91DRAFT_182651 [Kalaharituber pfeilii]|nr:hypothetical protein BDZ91DRAFT_182651 [Kalaharituber pfeilii]
MNVSPLQYPPILERSSLNSASVAPLPQDIRARITATLQQDAPTGQHSVSRGFVALCNCSLLGHASVLDVTTVHDALTKSSATDLQALAGCITLGLRDCIHKGVPSGIRCTS